jgi:hypothetical protein
MSQRVRRIMWFMGLYLASLMAYAAVALCEKYALHLLH